MELERDPYLVLGIAPGQDWSAVRRAYWTLARCFHPDGSAPDAARMTEINEAYARLERDHRARSNAAGVMAATGPVAMGPGLRPTPPRPAWPAAPGQPTGLLRRVADARFGDTPVIDFGQYAGWRIGEVAEHDPGYLRWLSRHSSGVRYRAAICEVLGSSPGIGRRAALVT